MPLNLKAGASCAPVALLLGRLYAAEPDAVLLQHLADADLTALWPLEDGAVVAGLRALQAEAARTLAVENAAEEAAAKSAAAPGGGAAPEAVPSLPDLREDYMRLFVGCGMPEAPLWGSVYLHEDNLLLQESTLALEDFWRQRGLACTLPGRQPLDHLGLCLEGLALLLARCGQTAGEEHAATAAPEETASQEITPEEAAENVRELLGVHVLPFAGRCTELMRQRARTDFYRAQARLTQALFSALLSFFDVRPVTRILYY